MSGVGLYRGPRTGPDARVGDAVELAVRKQLLPAENGLGLFTVPRLDSCASRTLTADTLYLYPMSPVERKHTLGWVRLRVVTAAAGSTVSVGLYAFQQRENIFRLVPDSVVTVPGSVATTTYTRELRRILKLQVGQLYFAAIVTDDAACGIAGVGTPTHQILSLLTKVATPEHPTTLHINELTKGTGSTISIAYLSDIGARIL